MTGIFAGADLGGTNFRVGLRDRGGTALSFQASLPACEQWGPEELAEQFRTLLPALQEQGENGRQIAGLGVALTGDVDPFTGMCHSMPRYRRLEETPLAAILNDRLGVPVSLINDGLAAALAEQQLGAGRGIDDFVMITLGTGIGGGVVLNGRLLTGSYGRVGRVGHQIIGLEGPVYCHCGHPGCWQSFAGKAAVEARMVGAAAEFPGSELARCLEAREPDLELLTRCASVGDTAAVAVLEETGRYVGIGLANLIKLFAPERVLLGGGIAQDNPVLIRAVETTVRQFAVKPWQVVPVVPAALGKDAGLIGATVFAEIKSGDSGSTRLKKEGSSNPQPEERHSR